MLHRFRARRRQNRRRLKFTREGKYFVALTLGIGFAAINTGNNLLYLILGVMLTMIVASGVLSELCLRALRVSRQPPERIFANHPFLTWIEVHNHKQRVPSFSIEVEDLAADTAQDDSPKRCFFLKIPPRGHQLTSYRHTIGCRGLWRLQAVRIKTRFPFGLFEKARTLPLAAELVVYPEISPVHAPLAALRGDGEDARAQVGRRGEFRALRDYREGDDPRDIFWRKSAKVGRLMVREHEDPRGRRINVLFDNREHEQHATEEGRRQQERAVSCAASLVVHYLNQGHTVALFTHSGQMRAGSGPAQIDRILRLLALIAFVDAPDAELLGKLPSRHLVVAPAPSGDAAPVIVRHAV